MPIEHILLTGIMKDGDIILRESPKTKLTLKEAIIHFVQDLSAHHEPDHYFKSLNANVKCIRILLGSFWIRKGLNSFVVLDICFDWVIIRLWLLGVRATVH